MGAMAAGSLTSIQCVVIKDILYLYLPTKYMYM